MKLKKSLVMVAVLFALSSLMAAMAYNTATVNSDETLKVVATNNALLALIPQSGVGNKDLTASVGADGVLDIDFGKSGINKNGIPGLQPGSTYTWDNLMNIWNKSAEDLDVTINVPTELAPYLTIKGSNIPNNWFTNISVFENGIPVTFTLGNDSTIPLAFEIAIPKGASLGAIDGTITVDATAK